MGFGEGKLEFKFGKGIGYILAYAIFTCALFFALTITKKNTPLIFVAMITAAIAAIGLLVKRLLK
jgi:hypothetical protein